MKKEALLAMKAQGKPVRTGGVPQALSVSKAVKILRGKGDIVSPKRCNYALS